MKALIQTKNMLFAFIGIILLFNSCRSDHYIDLSQVVAGQYEGYVVNGLYSFDIDVLDNGYDDVVIDALFDDYGWERVRAVLSDRPDGNISIDIYGQNVYGGARIWGAGVWDNGYLRLDYTIDWGAEHVIYRMIGNQY